MRREWTYSKLISRARKSVLAFMFIRIDFGQFSPPYKPLRQHHLQCMTKLPLSQNHIRNFMASTQLRFCINPCLSHEASKNASAKQCLVVP